MKVQYMVERDEATGDVYFALNDPSCVPMSRNSSAASKAPSSSSKPLIALWWDASNSRNTSTSSGVDYAILMTIFAKVRSGPEFA